MTCFANINDNLIGMKRPLPANTIYETESNDRQR
jgi:hypothetical protein